MKMFVLLFSLVLPCLSLHGMDKPATNDFIDLIKRGQLDKIDACLKKEPSLSQTKHGSSALDHAFMQVERNLDFGDAMKIFTSIEIGLSLMKNGAPFRYDALARIYEALNRIEQLLKTKSEVIEDTRRSALAIYYERHDQTHDFMDVIHYADVDLVKMFLARNKALANAEGDISVLDCVLSKAESSLNSANIVKAHKFVEIAVELIKNEAFCEDHHLATIKYFLDAIQEQLPVAIAHAEKKTGFQRSKGCSDLSVINSDL